MQNQLCCLNETPLDSLIEQIAQQGYAIVDDLLPRSTACGLLTDLTDLDKALFRRAAIGRAAHSHVNDDIRTDRIFWLESGSEHAALYLAAMDELRTALNRALFLGLFDYECHWAYYPPGAFYRRHIDAFRGSSNRRLSTVLYLNANWQSGDGGELVLYHPVTGEFVVSVAPRLGTMAVFLSEEFPHEVLPARMPRFSVTGWFHVNGSAVGPVQQIS